MAHEKMITFCQRDLLSVAFDVFQDMRQKEELCDVTIKVGNYTFIAHRAILAAAVPYFRSLFTGIGSLSGDKEITIGDMDPMVLEALLHFAYTSQITISAENAEKLLVASEIFQLDQVKNACVEFLSQRLDVKNVAQVRTFALKHNNRKLIENTKLYIRQNFEEFCKSDEFLHLPHSCFKEVISSDDLKISKEEIAFEAVMNWVKFLPSERADSLPELLSEVRMVHLPIRYLVNRIAEEELIRASTNCMCLIQKVQSYHLLPKEECSVFNLKTLQRTDWNIRDGIYALCYSNSTGYCVYYCDLIKQTWSVKKSEKLQLGDHLCCVAAANGSIYLFSEETIAKFHLNALEWEVAKTTHMHISGAAVLLHNEIIFCFGSMNSVFGNRVRCFDTRTDKWVKEYTMETYRCDCALTFLLESIYVTGGNDAFKVAINTAETFSPSTGQWNIISPMLNARESHGCTSMNGKIYVCGGCNGTMYVETAEVFDPLINKWNVISSPFIAVGRCSLITQNNGIFAFPRRHLFPFVGKFEMYDVESGKWTTSSFPLPPKFLTAILI